MAEPEAIDQFVLITGAPVHIATHVLEAHDWDVDAAVNFYLESGGVGHGNFGLPTEQVLPEPAPRPLPLPANAAPRSSPIEIVDEEDEDIQVLASNLNAGRRNSIDMLDDEEEEWRAAEMDLVDSDDDGGPRRRTQRRVRRNRPSRAAAADPNLPTLGPRNSSRDSAQQATNALNGMQLPDDIDMEEQRMLMAALTGEAYLGRIPDFGTDPRYRPRELSPGGMERERLRQEQDAAYEESLLMDKHKEEEEERLRRAAERAAAAAAAEEARKAREAEEAAAALERSLAEKEASLPPEPGPEEGDAVVLVVRLPKGGRLSRRFRQSDRLGAVFDYVDVSQRGTELSPGSYNLVSQFPRRVFQGDGGMTLADANLAHKQEALFIETK